MVLSCEDTFNVLFPTAFLFIRTDLSPSDSLVKYHKFGIRLYCCRIILVMVISRHVLIQFINTLKISVNFIDCISSIKICFNVKYWLLVFCVTCKLVVYQIC